MLQARLKIWCYFPDWFQIYFDFVHLQHRTSKIWLPKLKCKFFIRLILSEKCEQQWNGSNYFNCQIKWYDKKLGFGCDWKILLLCHVLLIAWSDILILRMEFDNWLELIYTQVKTNLNMTLNGPTKKNCWTCLKY